MIYIVRHGETNWNKEGRIQGHADIELNETGINQAKIIKERLKNIKFDKVFSSPLKRAYETAKIITDEDIVIDKRIIERCNGKLEGKLKYEIKEKIFFNDPSESRFEIENVVDLQNRVNDFLTEVLEKYKGKNVLIVTHAGVSINIRCFFEGKPNDGDFSKYKLENCEVLEYNNN